LAPFEEYDTNAADMLRVLEQHADAAGQLNAPMVQALWEETVLCCKAVGVRNSQVTVLAPTGTISFMMDCDTTGIEPDIALIKSKTLVGGGTIQLVNNSVSQALRNLGYEECDIDAAIGYLMDNHTLEGSPHVREEDLSIFSTSLGKNSISWMGHICMMAAAQPFISGAISKTINMPADSTAVDMGDAYMLGWKLGLKSVALYRDGSKAAQPVNIKKDAIIVEAAALAAKRGKGFRERLPDTRQSVTHKFTIGEHQGYFTIGLYPDGRPGELFISVAKEGSTLSGVFDCFGIAVSIALQYGVPLGEFIEKFSYVRFEPMGYTKCPDVRIAKSIIDYIFRWMAKRFTPADPLPPKPVEDDVLEEVHADPIRSLDAPICDNCGELSVRVGTCYLCYCCGSTGGCS
jgi:ribonucleoside-diphosphate reductase alpha chain